jgi:DEAD/DEAH box helicase domain-containing protein
MKAEKITSAESKQTNTPARPSPAPEPPEPAAHKAISAAIALLEKSGLSVQGTATLPGHAPSFDPVPAQLHLMVRDLLSQTLPAGLYSHQSKAIASIISGQDVCLSTSTASGKSLPFMATAAHALLTD